MFKHISRNSKPKLKRFNRFVKTPQKSCKKKHGTKNHVLSSQHSRPSSKTTLRVILQALIWSAVSVELCLDFSSFESYFWCIGVTFSELCSILCVYNSQKHHCLHYTAISIVSHYHWCDHLCSISGFVSHPSKDPSAFTLWASRHPKRSPVKSLTGSIRETSDNDSARSLLHTICPLIGIKARLYNNTLSTRVHRFH